ncbi:hypothetical protein EAH78_25170 [Pseudomonas arsenicoxydans]|uniref:Uncharacterized protein n=1 Tax=Pseudomonas arsenicoxydans TaxID=702115 RepID=A0A502HKN4_9PSED|nr:hypothetical protein EAH78_25170 [Pseudomonas arsenicoxydans]
MWTVGSCPDLICQQPVKGWHTTNLVGAELARDVGGSVSINAECTALIASKLGSYRFCVSGLLGNAARSRSHPGDLPGLRSRFAQHVGTVDFFAVAFYRG